MNQTLYIHHALTIKRNHRLRRPTLYPVELRGPVCGEAPES